MACGISSGEGRVELCGTGDQVEQWQGQEASCGLVWQGPGQAALAGGSNRGCLNARRALDWVLCGMVGVMMGLPGTARGPSWALWAGSPRDSGSVPEAERQQQQQQQQQQQRRVLEPGAKLKAKNSLARLWLCSSCSIPRERAGAEPNIQLNKFPVFNFDDGFSFLCISVVSPNTTQATGYGLNVQRYWCMTEGLKDYMDITKILAVKLSELLEYFYITTKETHGHEYSEGHKLCPYCLLHKYRYIHWPLT
ncbi:hypothetical protein WISP_64152 [Willisornis vidua]|uniref:Uncharacterized protein n=1 Tax=Willisornis vidua TaxID=1566151 RepID=A0ABQ9D9Q4_9PASS|nr:hypothetical protein WISP_64152 [Willisornis vidua]